MLQLHIFPVLLTAKKVSPSVISSAGFKGFSVTKMSNQEQTARYITSHYISFSFLGNETSLLLLQQLNINDDQVAAFLQELSAYLEGHLALLDAVSKLSH